MKRICNNEITYVLWICFILFTESIFCLPACETTVNEIFNQFSDFIIVYIDDVLVYSISVEQRWKHLNKFVQTVKSNGLSLSGTKINLFQTKIRFLDHHIYQGTITLIHF